jgi:glycine/D-amino acid oxidase-like deaminating enzyme
MYFQVTPYGEDRVRLTGFSDFVEPPLAPPLSHWSSCSAVPPAASTAAPVPDELLSDADRRRFKALLVDYVGTMLPDLRWASEQERAWCGLRPMSPDNLPLVGRAPSLGLPANVTLNCGHGPMGWANAACTASVAADVVFGAAGRAALDPAEWDLQRALSPERFSAAAFFK